MLPLARQHNKKMEAGSADGGAYAGDMPKIDLYGPRVDIRTVAPVFGVQREEEPDYLDYDIKGRGALEKMFMYSGASYLTGILSGGFLGGRRGYQAAPSPRFWIRINSLLNGAGKLGSKWGNNAAVLALMYSTAESTLEHYEVDKYLGGVSGTNPVLAGAATGLLYKCTAKSRTMALATVLGGIGAGLFHFGRGKLEQYYYGGMYR